MLAASIVTATADCSGFFGSTSIVPLNFAKWPLAVPSICRTLKAIVECEELILKVSARAVPQRHSAAAMSRRRSGFMGWRLSTLPGQEQDARGNGLVTWHQTGDGLPSGR